MSINNPPYPCYNKLTNHYQQVEPKPLNLNLELTLQKKHLTYNLLMQRLASRRYNIKVKKIEPHRQNVQRRHFNVKDGKLSTVVERDGVS